MLDFHRQRFNVLVCTTIIESGIDVPTANTIIIDRADHFGLAQLHQLRGRVGRSHHRAYAYLIVPDRKAMTADADGVLGLLSAKTSRAEVGKTIKSHLLLTRYSPLMVKKGEMLSVSDVLVSAASRPETAVPSFSNS